MDPLVPLDTVETLFDGTLTTPRLSHPEGLAVAADGAVWCGGENGEIYRIEPDGSALEVRASTGGFVLGMAFDRDGRLYVCDLYHRAVFRYDPSADELVEFARGGMGVEIRIPNWPVVDHDRGVLYVSDSHAPDVPGPGVWRFDLATGEGALWFDRDLTFANGMALAPGGEELYVAETFARRVVAIPVGAGGEAGEPRLVVDGIERLPDGLAFDAAGRLYIACYEPSRLYRYDGQALKLLVDDPEAHTLCHPTNCAFAGTDLLTSNLGRWHITRIPLGVEGLPLL
ncbi:MAG TPA: SMP-30/gluconolactonase/LRE family protein [Egibacteraceae bacterium]|nr:SMP-30/gluconolactonase/LRE family protein [Egibacteraceae bacterium]